MKEKIMLIVPMLHQGGFERVCVATARLLEPFYEVYIVVFDSKDIAYDIKGLNVIDLHLGVKKNIFGKCLNVRRRSTEVKKLKEKLGVDIAYSFGPSANMVNVFSKAGEKVWVGIRSYMDMANQRRISLFCKKADAVLCCSKMIEEEIRVKYNCTKAVTLYNPLDVKEILERAEAEEARLPWSDSEHIVASMGREDDVKGFWHLIKGFSLVIEEIPNAKLMIIGDGDFEEYRVLAKQLQIAEHVYFTGMKKNPFPYLKQAELYALTSYNEGFPNALLEAMTFGIPVIATDCLTGPREILLKEYVSMKKELRENKQEAVYGDYGILIPNMSPEKNLKAEKISEGEKELAAEMIKLLTDREHYQKYSEASLLRAKDFSNESYVCILKNQMDNADL